MKVYIVVEFDYDGCAIHGVFLNKFDAKQYLEPLPASMIYIHRKVKREYFDIEEHEVQG